MMNESNYLQKWNKQQYANLLFGSWDPFEGNAKVRVNDIMMTRLNAIPIHQSDQVDSSRELNQCMSHF